MFNKPGLVIHFQHQCNHCPFAISKALVGKDGNGCPFAVSKATEGKHYRDNGDGKY